MVILIPCKEHLLDHWASRSIMGELDSFSFPIHLEMQISVYTQLREMHSGLLTLCTLKEGKVLLCVGLGRPE